LFEEILNAKQDKTSTVKIVNQNLLNHFKKKKKVLFKTDLFDKYVSDLIKNQNGDFLDYVRLNDLGKLLLTKKSHSNLASNLSYHARLKLESNQLSVVGVKIEDDGNYKRVYVKKENAKLLFEEIINQKRQTASLVKIIKQNLLDYSKRDEQISFKIDLFNKYINNLVKHQSTNLSDSVKLNDLVKLIVTGKEHENLVSALSYRIRVKLESNKLPSEGVKIENEGDRKCVYVKKENAGFLLEEILNAKQDKTSTVKIVNQNLLNYSNVMNKKLFSEDLFIKYINQITINNEPKFSNYVKLNDLIELIVSKNACKYSTSNLSYNIRLKLESNKLNCSGVKIEEVGNRKSVYVKKENAESFLEKIVNLKRDKESIVKVVNQNLLTYLSNLKKKNLDKIEKKISFKTDLFDKYVNHLVKNQEGKFSDYVKLHDLVKLIVTDYTDKNLASNFSYNIRLKIELNKLSSDGVKIENEGNRKKVYVKKENAGLLLEEIVNRKRDKKSIVKVVNQNLLTYLSNVKKKNLDKIENKISFKTDLLDKYVNHLVKIQEGEFSDYVKLHDLVELIVLNEKYKNEVSDFSYKIRLKLESEKLVSDGIRIKTNGNRKKVYVKKENAKSFLEGIVNSKRDKESTVKIVNQNLLNKTLNFVENEILKHNSNSQYVHKFKQKDKQKRKQKYKPRKSIDPIESRNPQEVDLSFKLELSVELKKLFDGYVKTKSTDLVNGKKSIRLTDLIKVYKNRSYSVNYSSQKQNFISTNLSNIRYNHLLIEKKINIGSRLYVNENNAFEVFEELVRDVLHIKNAYNINNIKNNLLDFYAFIFKDKDKSIDNINQIDLNSVNQIESSELELWNKGKTVKYLKLEIPNIDEENIKIITSNLLQKGLSKSIYNSSLDVKNLVENPTDEVKNLIMYCVPLKELLKNLDTDKLLREKTNAQIAVRYNLLNTNDEKALYIIKNLDISGELYAIRDEKYFFSRSIYNYFEKDLYIPVTDVDKGSYKTKVIDNMEYLTFFDAIKYLDTDLGTMGQLITEKKIGFQKNGSQILYSYYDITKIKPKLKQGIKI
jgi:hypothetical protein